MLFLVSLLFISLPSVTALPAEMLHLHLAIHHFITSGTKAAMALRLIHSSSSVATATAPNLQGFLGIVPPSSSSPPTSNQPIASRGITPAHLSTFLQLLAQTLHQNPSALSQQLSIPTTSLLPSINSPPAFSVAQHGSAITQPTVLTSTISHAPPLRPQGTNEDALSTASNSLSLAATTSGVGTDPSVSLSLQPVH